MRAGREFETEAIVLKARTTGENDLWVDLLTPDHGRLHAIARHGRKSHKRFGTVLECLNWVKIRAKEGMGLASLSEASLVAPWRRLDTSLPLLTAGFHVMELVRQLVPERSPDARVFDLVCDCLRELDKSDLPDPLLTVARFEYRMLEFSGFGPNLRKCLGCARARDREETFSFVYKEGGLYCLDCLKQRPFQSGGCDLFTRKSAPAILSRFLEYQLGKPLKTVKFLTDKAFCG